MKPSWQGYEMSIKNIIKCAAFSSFMIVGAQAQASSISYYLDQSNVLPDGVNYAQVTISDGVTGDINFNVQVNTSAFSGISSNFGMQAFSFNYDNTLAVSSTNITNIDPSSWTISDNKNAGGGFGKFDFQLAGTGSSRTLALNFTISDVTGDSINSYAIGSGLKPSSGDFFAAHIAGFTYNGVTYDGSTDTTSAQFAGSTPAVPVPAAAWLFASGLLGLVGVARRRS
jgi:hypothetical protein